MYILNGPLLITQAVLFNNTKVGIASNNGSIIIYLDDRQNYQSFTNNITYLFLMLLHKKDLQSTKRTNEFLFSPNKELIFVTYKQLLLQHISKNFHKILT